MRDSLADCGSGELSRHGSAECSVYRTGIELPIIGFIASHLFSTQTSHLVLRGLCVI